RCMIPSAKVNSFGLNGLGHGLDQNLFIGGRVPNVEVRLNGLGKGGQLFVNVKTLTGKTITLEVKSIITIYKLKSLRKINFCW
ncbi:8269_t:CDS:1, partial [Funneliformis caledonium]